MKKILALVLALVMLISTASFAFGAVNTDLADDLNSLELFLGKPGVGYDLDAALTRAEAVVLIERALGLEADAMVYVPVVDPFTDVTSDDWFYGYVTYAADNGIALGIGGGLFDPNAAISGIDFATLLLRNIFPSNTDLNDGSIYEDAALDMVNELGLLSITEILSLMDSEVAFTRDLAVKMVFNILMVENEDGITVIQALINAGVVTEEDALATGLASAVNVEPEVVPLAVEDITVPNLVEVVVIFNQAPGAGAGDIANYVVVDELGALTITEVNVSGNIATLSLDPSDPIGTGSRYDAIDVTVTVKTGTGLAAAYAQVISEVIDFSVPTVVDIITTGPTTHTVVFSEPINPGNNVLIKVNQGVLFVGNGTISGNTASFELAGASAGDMFDVTVSGAADYAGYFMKETTLSYTFTPDATPLQVASVTATPETVVITFNKAIVGISSVDVLNFYHTYPSFNPLTAVLSGATLTLTFGPDDSGNAGTNEHLLPEGMVDLMFKAGDGTTGNIWQDVWGNKLTGDHVLTVEVVIDKGAPVASIKSVTETQVVVEFSKEVNLDGAEFTLSNDPTNVRTFSGNATEVTLVFAGGAKLAGGDYTVKIEGIKDTTFNQNAMATATLGFTVTDLTPPSVVSALVEYNEYDPTNPVYVTINFNEAMATSGSGSVLDINNYRYMTSETETPLPASATASLIDADSVLITIAGADVADPADFLVFFIGQLADISGNALVPLKSAVTTVVQSGSTYTVEATPIATNKIVVTIDKVVSGGLAVSSFSINNGSIFAPATIAYSYDGNGNTIITLTLPAGQTVDLTGGDYVTIGNLVLTTDKGYTLATQTVEAIDSTSPYLVSAEWLFTGTTQINANYGGVITWDYSWSPGGGVILTFSENIDNMFNVWVELVTIEDPSNPNYVDGQLYLDIIVDGIGVLGSNPGGAVYFTHPGENDNQLVIMFNDPALYADATNIYVQSLGAVNGKIMEDAAGNVLVPFLAELK